MASPSALSERITAKTQGKVSNNAVKDDVRHKQKIIEVSTSSRIIERCLCNLHRYLVCNDYDIYSLRYDLKCNLTDFSMELVVSLPPKQRAMNLGAVCGPPPLNEHRY